MSVLSRLWLTAFQVVSPVSPAPPLARGTLAQTGLCILPAILKPPTFRAADVEELHAQALLSADPAWNDVAVDRSRIEPMPLRLGLARLTYQSGRWRAEAARH